MGVEPGGDDQQAGSRNGRASGRMMFRPRGAEGGASREPGRSGALTMLSWQRCLVRTLRRCRDTTWVLVRGGVEQVGVGGEHRLRAPVAVVHVESPRRRRAGCPSGLGRGAAATAALLNRQKPIELRRGSAWWPERARGGEGGSGPSPSITASTAATAAPAARRAASALPWLVAVSASSWTVSCSAGRINEQDRILDVVRRVDAGQRSLVACGADSRSRSANSSASRAARTARRRSRTLWVVLAHVVVKETGRMR